MSKAEDSIPENTPRKRRTLRFVLLVAVPLLAAVGGLYVYLQGGRYVSTDNAYVTAQKVLITPEVSGKVASIAVAEGQHINQGDVLFTVDRRPYELALNKARAELARTQHDFAGLKDKLRGLDKQIALARETLQLRQSEVDRKTSLQSSRVVARSEVENERINLQQARQDLAALEQNRQDVLNELGGDMSSGVDQYAPYLAARSALEKAQWDLDQTELHAPIAGVATQVPNIQLGRYLTAGTPVFAIVSESSVWVEANPKETDITYLAPAQDVTVTVDALPGTEFHGKVASISPGTGSVFSLIPPQNAAGNWVKVVQRVPVRIEFDAGQDLSRLRTGMSANVAIDTHRTRSLATLLGGQAVAQTIRQ